MIPVPFPDFLNVEPHYPAAYGINLSKRVVCYAVGVAPSGKGWSLFVFLSLFCVDFRPFSKVGRELLIT